MDEREIIREYNKLKSEKNDLTPLIDDIEKLLSTTNITPNENLELKTKLVGISIREGTIRERAFELLHKKIRQLQSKYSEENIKKEEVTKRHTVTAKIHHAVDMRRRRLAAKRRKTKKVIKKPNLGTIREDGSSSNSSSSNSSSSATSNSTPPIQAKTATPSKSSVSKSSSSSSSSAIKKNEARPPYVVAAKNSNSSSRHSAPKYTPSLSYRSSSDKSKPKKKEEDCVIA